MARGVFANIDGYSSDVVPVDSSDLPYTVPEGRIGIGIRVSLEGEVNVNTLDGDAARLMIFLAGESRQIMFKGIESDNTSAEGIEVHSIAYP